MKIRLNYTILVASLIVSSGCQEYGNPESSQNTRNIIPVSAELKSASADRVVANSNIDSMVLAQPANNELWHASGLTTAARIRSRIELGQLDAAIELTKIALTLPRHPNRNDPNGWGHATMAMQFMTDGLVEAEEWDKLIELSITRNAEAIGNEWVESHRLRALALAHWKKRQFVFRSKVLLGEVNKTKRALKKRLSEHEIWNQTCTPEELQEINREYFRATEQHCDDTIAFIKKLEQTKTDNGQMAELKSLFFQSSLRENDAESANLTTTEANAEEVGRPRLAPKFCLPTADGTLVTLAKAERPTLVVFYLGRTCLHCAKQLKEFAPRISEFEDAGISVFGISTDTKDELAAALNAYEGRIPFRLLSDSGLKVFNQYGLIRDDGEDPYHATFLIDGAGTVIWHDVGVEPFTDIKFLLQESLRLLDK